MSHFIPCNRTNDATHISKLYFQQMARLHGIPDVRPAFLSYLPNKYYACWVGKFYFNIRQPTTAISPK